MNNNSNLENMPELKQLLCDFAKESVIEFQDKRQEKIDIMKLKDKFNPGAINCYNCAHIGKQWEYGVMRYRKSICGINENNEIRNDSSCDKWTLFLTHDEIFGIYEI